MPAMEPAAPAWLGQEQPRGTANKAQKRDTWTQLAASKALEEAKKTHFEGTVTNSPRDGYTGLWTPEDGRNLELAIRFDSNGLPFLGHGTTLYYHCLASRKDSGEHSDPPAYVHMSGRLPLTERMVADLSAPEAIDERPWVIEGSGIRCTPLSRR